MVSARTTTQAPGAHAADPFFTVDISSGKHEREVIDGFDLIGTSWTAPMEADFLSSFFFGGAPAQDDGDTAFWREPLLRGDCAPGFQPAAAAHQPPVPQPGRPHVARVTSEFGSAAHPAGAAAQPLVSQPGTQPAPAAAQSRGAGMPRVCQLAAAAQVRPGTPVFQPAAPSQVSPGTPVPQSAWQTGPVNGTDAAAQPATQPAAAAQSHGAGMPPVSQPAAAAQVRPGTPVFQPAAAAGYSPHVGALDPNPMGEGPSAREEVSACSCPFCIFFLRAGLQH